MELPFIVTTRVMYNEHTPTYITLRNSLPVSEIELHRLAKSAAA